MSHVQSAQVDSTLRPPKIKRLDQNAKKRSRNKNTRHRLCQRSPLQRRRHPTTTPQHGPHPSPLCRILTPLCVYLCLPLCPLSVNGCRTVGGCLGAMDPAARVRVGNRVAVPCPATAVVAFPGPAVPVPVVTRRQRHQAVAVGCLCRVGGLVCA